MRQLLIVPLVLVACDGARAGDLDSLIMQQFGAKQIVRQSMSQDDAAADLAVMTERAAAALRQYGTNSVNTVSSGMDLQTVTQSFTGQQIVDNRMSGIVMAGAADVEQFGANIAGLIDGRTVDLAVQFMGPEALQKVINEASLDGQIGLVVQTGINTANMAIAEYSIGTGDQAIVPGAVQRVDNRLQVGAIANIAERIEQSGANYGNVMVSNRVERVRRIFAGTQIVTNTVVLDDPNNVPPIRQSGVNVANSLSANIIGAIEQVSSGQQIVVNKVLGPDGAEIVGANIDQSTMNIVNLTSLGPLPASMQDEAPPVEVTQEANFPQSSQGGGSGQSQVGNAVSIER